MKKQALPATKLLAALVAATLSLPLASLAAGTTTSSFGDLPLATLVPNTLAVVDPDLETPAWVSFEAVGGLPVTGKDAASLGRAVFSHPMVVRMFGTLNADEHLNLVSAFKDHRGDLRIVFEQRERGTRVEGAYLTVTVSANSRVREIHGRFVFFPQVDWSALMASADLEEQAKAAYQDVHCGKEDCWLPLDGEGRPVPAEAELVVLSSRLFPGAALAPASERLAWRYAYPLADIYVDASGKEGALLDLARRLDDMPHDIYDRNSNSLQVSTDPAQTGAAHPLPEAVAAGIMIDAVDAFYKAHGRNGYDGVGGLIQVWVNWEAENAAFLYNGSAVNEHPWLPGQTLPPALAFFGEDYLVADVVGHELTHGVTVLATGLKYAGESGALNESYSDVIGNLIFPDRVPGQWLEGEDRKRGAGRDMANPSQSPVPTVGWQPDHVMNLPYGCLTTDDHCVHTWSGVPNLAAVLIAQGGSVPSSGASLAQGIGREKLAVLYFQTLTGGRLGPASNFLSQRLATLSECQDLVASGYTAAGSQPFTAKDCAIVAEAFDAVGISDKPSYGWMRFPSGFGPRGADVDFFAGERLFNGCIVDDQRLALWSDQGAVGESTLATGLSVDMGGWGGQVTRRGADTDLADRSATVHLWANWAVPAPTVSFTDSFLAPAGLSQAQCLTPLPQAGERASHRRRLYSTQRISHWASFFNGGRYDEVVNGGARLPVWCKVAYVRGLPMDRTVPVGAPVPVMDFDSHGFRVAAGQPSDRQALDAQVHSWHDGLSAIALRVAYDLDEEDGTDCLVPGLLQESP